MFMHIQKRSRSASFKKSLPIFLLSSIVAIFIIYLLLFGNLFGDSELPRVESVKIDLATTRKNPTDWKFNTAKYYPPSVLKEWTESAPIIIQPLVPGNGDYGEEFTRIDASDSEMMKLYEENNYNLMATEMMSIYRGLRDYRCDECTSLVYPKWLPKASIIINFHNEPWSLILRTIWSIINRSPRELIDEIILVDDFSTETTLQRPLEDYIEILPAHVRLIRTKQREGSIRSRLIGADAANGQTLVFLDAHIEATDGWLEPLLANIAVDRSLVAVPHIDRINERTFRFEDDESGQFHRYSLDLSISSADFPERELKRTKNSKTALIRLPTHPGCAFAIDREFFFEIGALDEDMDILGFDNMELAFRVWMCGGSLQLVQCSRVGHLNREPIYSFNGNKDTILAHNRKRLAEVWMDGAKETLYSIYPNMKDIDAGDLTKRKDLRNRLACKSFQWYLENIYPESEFRLEFLAVGEIRNMADDRCVDNYDIQSGSKVITYGCHNGKNQFFGFLKNGWIMTDNHDLCIGVPSGNSTAPSGVIIVECSAIDKAQLWQYTDEDKAIKHVESGLCMRNEEATGEIELAECNPNNFRAKWKLNQLNK